MAAKMPRHPRPLRQELAKLLGPDTTCMRAPLVSSFAQITSFEIVSKRTLNTVLGKSWGRDTGEVVDNVR